MTATYSYEKAKKSFDLVLKKAFTDGKVTIKKDDQLYILMPAAKNTSALDVESVDTDISSKDILQFIHESRKR